MKREDAEALLGSYLTAAERAAQAAHLAFGPSSPEQREAAQAVIIEAQNARERIIVALMGASS